MIEYTNSLTLKSSIYATIGDIMNRFSCFLYVFLLVTMPLGLAALVRTGHLVGWVVAGLACACYFVPFFATCQSIHRTSNPV